MDLNLTKTNAFIARWKTAIYHAHQSDYLKATIARDLWAELGGNKDAAYRFLHRHITKSAPAKNMLRNMVSVIDVVPDRRVWLAVGWAGANKLAGMTEKTRAKKIKAILKEAEKTESGRVPKKKAAKILPALAPKPRPAATKPVATVATASTQPTKPVATVDNSDHVLAEELRRLVADPLIGPALLAHLSAKAAKLVAPKSSKKSA